MEERRNLIKWVKKNKKKLVAVGIGIGTLILIILGIKNKDAIKTLWNSLRTVTEKPSTNATEAITKVISESPPKSVQEAVSAITTASESIPFEVSKHIRKLPKGRHASPEKVDSALRNNIILMDGYTWVDSYMKGGTAA